MTLDSKKISPDKDAQQQAQAQLPTDWGVFIITAHADDTGEYSPHFSLCSWQRTTTVHSCVGIYL